MAAEVSKTEAGKNKAVKAVKTDKVDKRFKPRKRAESENTEQAEMPNPIVDKGVNAEEEPVDDPRAFEKMGIYARIQLGRNSALIAKKVADNALKGDCTSARLILDLGKAGEKYKKKKSGPSVPLALGNEPPWMDGRKKKDEVTLAVPAE